MAAQPEQSVYTELGVRPIVNASGSRTVMGGSRPSPTVMAAAAAANRHYVVMEELLAQSGQAIADLLQAEKALVTSGCAAAMTLGVAGIMTGTDAQRIAQLPDCTGLRHEIIIQQCQRYSYDRALELCGAKLVNVGTATTTTVAAVEAAINENTAALHYLGIDNALTGLPFTTLRDIAHAHNLPILVDAASVVYPLEDMTWYLRHDADLVCFGAKYFGSFNGTGILCGKEKLMEAAILHNFISFETLQNRAIGRPFKLDRGEIVGVVSALREWFTMDHEERLAELEARSLTVCQAVTGLPHIEAHWKDMAGNSIMYTVILTLDEEALGLTAQAASQMLLDGEPHITTLVMGNELRLVMNTLYEGEAEMIGQRLQEVLSP